MPSEPYAQCSSLPNYSQTPRSTFSTPTLNQFFSMGVIPGKLLSLSTTNTKPSSTGASDRLLRYGGLTKYQSVLEENQTGRNKHNNHEKKMELDWPHSEKTQQIQPNKHWIITHKEIEDKEGQKLTGDAPHYKILIKWGSSGKKLKLYAKQTEESEVENHG